MITQINDTYKTLKEASKEILFKEKNSKFFGYAFPVSSEETIKEHIEVARTLGINTWQILVGQEDVTNLFDKKIL